MANEKKGIGVGGLIVTVLVLGGLAFAIAFAAKKGQKAAA
jgi:hypothetical protein